MNSSKEILYSQGIHVTDAHLITNVQWKVQSSNAESVLFYKFINKDESEREKFQERIKSASYSVCIVNDEKASNETNQIFAVSDEAFLDLQINLLHHLYPISYEKFKMIGVTGTNGKTTTVDLIRQLAFNQHKNILTIGTLGVFYNDEFVKTFSLTTPSLIDLHKEIFSYNERVDVVAMEMSSHALEQKRFGVMQFDSIGWTNFTQDHLDYHQTMEDYFQAKMKVFDHLDPKGEFYIPKKQIELGKMIGRPVKLAEYEFQTENLFLKAAYNQENLALAVCLLGSSIQKELINLNLIKPTPGRFNIIKSKNNYIVIDFAHTPDGLISIGTELKNTFPGKKIVTVFGCGGDRDREKRPLMGKAVSHFSDETIVTSDNPRFEDPMQIIKDIIPGIKCDYKICVDRKEAIALAMQSLSNSVLLIAGKGHEDYIDQNGIKTYYSDREEVEKNIHD